MEVKPFQIVAWVGIGVKGLLEPGQDAPRFPSVLDIGNTHNFAIREEHLMNWAGLQPQHFRARQPIRLGGQQVPVLAGNIWLYPNVRGKRDVLLGALPFQLELPDGIAMYPRGMPGAPRLPMIGLRALVWNNLLLTVNAHNRRVAIRTAYFWE